MILRILAIICFLLWLFIPVNEFSNLALPVISFWFIFILAIIVPIGLVKSIEQTITRVSKKAFLYVCFFITLFGFNFLYTLWLGNIIFELRTLEHQMTCSDLSKPLNVLYSNKKTITEKAKKAIARSIFSETGTALYYPDTTGNAVLFTPSKEDEESYTEFANGKKKFQENTQIFEERHKNYIYLIFMQFGAFFIATLTTLHRRIFKKSPSA